MTDEDQRERKRERDDDRNRALRDCEFCVYFTFCVHKNQGRMKGEESGPGSKTGLL